jgi:S-adenosylmethionine:tRNA ribosyltransferase-isomerase
MNLDLLSSYDYELPEAQIAQHPAARRDASRLLAIPRGADVEHRVFGDLVTLFRPGDLIVRNNTKVLPARLIGTRPTGGRVELLLLEPLPGPGVAWRAMAKPARALHPGGRLSFGSRPAVIRGKHADGTVDVDFPIDAAQFDALLAEEGRMPLPPYIRRGDNDPPAVPIEDRERYQTVYAREPGAVAAPTAGLHFTDDVFAQLAAAGVQLAEVTLHVGAGTFAPVRVERLDDHVMHRERFELTAEAAAQIQTARREGRRVIAVGTTTARVLETLGAGGRELVATRGDTNLFIRPGHAWSVVDALVTNFHLPKSTLLVLVCALAGPERMLAAYRAAVAAGYRFFSYGDACWIERT